MKCGNGQCPHICENSFECDMRNRLIDPKSNGMQNAHLKRKINWAIQSVLHFRDRHKDAMQLIQIAHRTFWFRVFQMNIYPFFLLHFRFTKCVNSYSNKRSHRIGEWFKEMQKFTELHHTLHEMSIIIAAYIFICIFDLFTRYGIECLCLLHRCCMRDKWIHKNQTHTQIGLSFGSTSRLTWRFFLLLVWKNFIGKPIDGAKLQRNSADNFSHIWFKFRQTFAKVGTINVLSHYKTYCSMPKFQFNFYNF